MKGPTLLHVSARHGLGLFFVAVSLTGCPNPNTYGTPRTVAPGKISHSIAAEWAGWKFDVREPSGDPDNPTGEVVSNVDGSLMVLPTYALRLGVAEQVDVGFRVANMSALGADVKYNFVRSETIDLAIDPGVQWMAVGFNVYHLHLPLLVGINLSEQLTLVLTPGVMYGVSTFRSGSEAVDSELRQLLTADGLYARAGLGFNIRFTKRFALHPELTFLRSLQSDSESSISNALTYMFGVGFNFGNLPEYGQP